MSVVNTASPEASWRADSFGTDSVTGWRDGEGLSWSCRPMETGLSNGAVADFTSGLTSQTQDR